MAQQTMSSDQRGGVTAHESTGPDFRLNDPWEGTHSFTIVLQEKRSGTKFACDGSCGKPACSETEFVPNP